MNMQTQVTAYRTVGNVGGGKLWRIDKISSWQKNFGKWTQYPIGK